jgi:tRNA uridine 5-carboxymethylaminomethyl modification enzyme
LNQDGQRRSAFELLSYPGIGIADLTRVWPEMFGPLDLDIANHLEIDAKYAVYLERQAADVEAFRRDENLLLGDEIDYTTVTGLSNEARQRLAAARPRTIGQAARLDGLTPAALTLLAAHLKRRERNGKAKVALK